MRRLLTVAFLAVLVSTSAACGNTSNDTSSGAAPSVAASSASPSPTVDVKANTTTVCGKAEKIVSADNIKALGTQIGLVIAAKQQKNKANQTKAEGAAKTQADALAKQLTDLKAEAVDPKLQAALDKAAAGVALLGAPDYLAKINTVADLTTMEKDLTAAGTDLETICA